MKIYVALVLTLVIVQAPIAQAQNTTERGYDNSLDEVIEADDPTEAAETAGLTHRNGSVLLVIEMDGDSNLSAYDVDTVQKYTDGNRSLIEAYVPVGDIRKLANDTAVEYVRPPSQPVAQSPETGDTEATDNNTGAENDTETMPSEDPSENASDGESANGFTILAAFVSVTLVALYTRCSQ
jgi:hypothetical protein